MRTCQIVLKLCSLTLALLALSCSKAEPELASPIAVASSETEKSAVALAWSQLKQAMLESDGEAAASRVTKVTHEYYEELRKAALSAERGQLEEMVFAKRFTVLAMRFRMTKEELTKMSGREVFVHAVEEGWVGKDGVTKVEIGEFTVAGAHASAPLLSAGRESGLVVHFDKEEGAWKLDMMQFMKFANLAFDKMLAESQFTEEEFTKKLLGAVTGREVTEEVWIPLDKRP